MPVSVIVIEVGSRIDTGEACERLEQYRRASMTRKLVLAAYLVDTAQRTVWINRQRFLQFAAKRFIENLLSNPHETYEQLREASQGPVFGPHGPP